MTAVRHPRLTTTSTPTNSRGMYEPRYTWITYRESRGRAVDGIPACGKCGCVLEAHAAHSPRCPEARA